MDSRIAVQEAELSAENRPEQRPSGLLREARRHELSERTRAVTDDVLFGRVQFAERLPSAAWQEHRVIAEALVSARWPCRLPIDAADEGFRVLIRPGEAQRG